MAKSKDNIVMEGVSGKIGPVVFRQRAGTTIVGRAPKERTQPPTFAQLQVQERFREAATYAKSVMTDPILKAAYKAVAKPGVSAYNVAFADFFKDPRIDSVDTGDYTGLMGQLISARATDNFRLVSVKVDIKHPDGSLLESGNAVKQVDGITWKYTTTQSNTLLTGSLVVVTATDNPGHFVVETKTLV